MTNFLDKCVGPEDQSRFQRRRPSMSALLEACRNALRWDELSRPRRTAVTLMAYATLGGLACTIVFLAQNRYADARPFAGITVVLAVATAGLQVASLMLRRRHHCFLYGISAIGGSVAFATVAITARTSSDIVSALALLPPLAGSWFAVHWVARLSALGLPRANFVDATTTVRGTAAIWCVVFVLTVGGALVAATGHGGSITPELGDGLTGLFGVAAVFTYAGPGWTEYQRGLATASVACPSMAAGSEEVPQ